MKEIANTFCYFSLAKPKHLAEFYPELFKEPKTVVKSSPISEPSYLDKYVNIYMKMETV